MADVQHADLTSIHPFAYVGSSDPGAVGANKGWIDTTTTPPILKKRKSDDSGWDVVSNDKSLSDAIKTPRIGTVASSATPAPNADTDDVFTVTALAANATFAAPSGTPADGQPLLIRIKDNGTARTLAWNAIYRAVGVTLPTTTVISKVLYVGCVYNSAATKWDVLGVSQEA